MHVLAVLTFYGLLVSSTVGGLVFFFRVGRFGTDQVGHLIDSTLAAAPEVTSEDLKGAAGVATGLPTSIPDFLLWLTPIGWLMGVRSCIILFNRSPSYALSVALIGGFIGKLWYTVSIPLFALEIGLGTHARYWPQWFTANHVTNGRALLYVTILWLGAYVLGRSFGSSARTYNSALASYKRTCRPLGDWFDNRGDATHYQQCTKSLLRVLAKFDKVLAELGEHPATELGQQRVMMVQYQRAVLLATLARYDQALEALQESRRLKALIEGSPHLSPDEDQRMESSLLFVEGELLAVEGKREPARLLFERSKSIDIARGDSDGVQLNDDRLAAV